MKKIFTLFAALMMIFSMNAATKTIYFKTQQWWHKDGAASAAYYWEPSAAPTWPGVRMTKVEGEANMWSVDIDTDKYKKIIFTRVNGSGAVQDWGAKTQDLTIPTDGKNLFTLGTTEVWGGSGASGTWSTYAPEAPKTYKNITITVVANATPKIHYWEGGDKMVGTDYNSMPEMNATGAANTYSYTIKDVDEATGVNYLIKVGAVQSSDQHADKDVTINFKEILPQVAVQGVNNWNGTDVMTVADDYLSASITLPLIAKKYDLKLTVAGAWKGHKNENNITRTNNSSVFKNDDGNGSITADIAGDYVFTYTYATQTLVVTYPALPVKYNVTVTAENGTVTGAGEYEEGKEATLTATAAEGYEFTCWTSGEDTVSTKNPYTFTVKSNVALVANFAVVEPEVIEYVLNGGVLPLVGPTNAELWGTDTADVNGLMHYFNHYYDLKRSAQDISAAASSNPVATFLTGMPDDAGIFVNEESKYKWLGDYIVKVTNDQIAEGKLSVLKAVDTNIKWRYGVQAFFMCLPATDNNYKGWADFTEAGKPENWVNVYPDAKEVELPTEPVEEDYVLPTPTKSGSTFKGWYDNAEGKGEAYTVIPAGWAGTLYAIWKQGTTTALENIAVEGKAVKAIVNGQLIIIKNGVQYNAQGQVVK